jgi:uncharacterized protein
LDIFGRWDPSLAFVMAGALVVNILAYRWVARRRQPVLSDEFAIPSRSPIDAKLLAGAAIFGVGWGLGGYCPGPSLVSLPSGGAGVLTFVTFMVVGIAGTAMVERLRSEGRSTLAAGAPLADDA